jgi:hypothetical protein
VINLHSQDPISQYPGYITYAGSNPYHPLVSSTVIARANTSWNTATTGCKARVRVTQTYLTSVILVDRDRVDHSMQQRRLELRVLRRPELLQQQYPVAPCWVL